MNIPTAFLEGEFQETMKTLQGKICPSAEDPRMAAVIWQLWPHMSPCDGRGEVVISDFVTVLVVGQPRDGG